MSAVPTPPLPPNRNDDDDLYLVEREPRRRPRWKRIIGWTFGGLLLLVLVLIVGVIALLNSSKFHDYVLRTAQEKGTVALGSNVKVRDYQIHWTGMSPSLELWGVRIAGADPYPDPPVLEAEHLSAQITITSLFSRQFYINDVSVQHPVVRIFVDSKGVNNLPKSKSEKKSSNQTNIFDLGIRHAKLEGGELYYNNKKSILEADLHDLNFQSVFDTNEQKYSGTLSYKNGHLKLEKYDTIGHNFEAKFALTPQAFMVEGATLTSGNSKIVLDATATDLTSPKIQAKYNASVDAGEVRRLLKNQMLPSGTLQATGSLKYATNAERQPIENVELSGDLKSSHLAVNANGLRTDIRNLAARYSVSGGNAEVHDLTANVLGGRLTGAMKMDAIAGNSKSAMNVKLEGASLAQLASLKPGTVPQRVDVTGRFDATATANWGKTMDNLVAHADTTIKGAATAKDGTAAVPVDGRIVADYSGVSQQVALHQSFIRTPKTSLTLDGTVASNSALRVNLQANDLHELETVAGMFTTPASPMNLYGTASFNGTVSGSTSAPQIRGQLNAQNVKAKGTQWRSLKTGIDANPSSARLSNGELVAAEKGKITFDLRAGLNDWKYVDTNPIEAKVNASQMNVEQLLRAAGFAAPVSGTLALNVDVRGSQANPIGNGNVTLNNAVVYGEPLQTLKADFNGNGQVLDAKLQAKLAAGEANGTVHYLPQQKAYDAQLTANGIKLDQLQTVKARNLQMRGVLNLNASGKGTIDNPSLTATVEIPELIVRDQKISQLKLKSDVANHLAKFDLDSSVLSTAARGHGTVALQGDYMADVVFDTGSMPFEPLVALYAPAQAGNLTGQTEVHATLRGPLKDKNRIEAHVTIPHLAVNYKNAVQLAAAAPIRADFTNGILEVHKSAIRGTGTNLEFEATYPTATTAPASLLLVGTIDLALLQIVAPDVTSSGQLQLNINSYGRTNDPNVQGTVKIVNANLATAGAPLGLSNGNGTMTLTKDRVVINEFTGKMGGGTVSATGGVVYRPTIQFDVALKGEGVRMLYVDSVRTGFNTNLSLVGNTENAALRGQVEIAQLSFTPDFDMMDFMGQIGGNVAAPPASQGFTQNLALDIGVHSSTGVNLISRNLSVQGQANLRVKGTAAEPVILGRINLSGGDLIFRGNRYVLQGGTIDFANPNRTEPVMNVAVNTQVNQYNIQMHFWGPADHMHTNYSSDPALPPTDIINLIAFGKTTEATEANPNPPGNLGAQSLIASQVSSQITNRLEKVAGISHLSVDPVLGGNGQSPGARVAIQQRVTSKLFVTFATDVTSTQKQVIKLEYQFNPRTSVSVTRDQNGGFAIDSRFKKSW